MLHNRLKHMLLLIMLMLSPVTLFAQNCFSFNDKTVPDSRYTVLGDAKNTVLDEETQLIWKRCVQGFVWNSSTSACGYASQSSFTWKEAFEQVDVANNNAFAASSDWRLPNYKELSSIIEFACDEPAVNDTIFPNTGSSSSAWSSSTVVDDATLAWAVLMQFGFGFKSSKAYVKTVRLVRDAD